MNRQTDRIRSDVYALLSDLLPILRPGATFDPDVEEVVLPIGEDRARVSTSTLLAACEPQPSRAWPQTVEGWLREVNRQVAEASGATPARPEALRVQAAPKSDEPPAGLSAPLNSAFDLVVVEDREGATRRLMQSDLDALELSPEAAVRTALDQTIGEVLVRLDVQRQTLPGGVELRVASAEGVPYVSAGVTSIPQLAGTDLPYGAVVGVPRHSMLLILPIGRRDDLAAVAVLEGFVASMFDDGVDRCSRGLHWFVNGDAFPIGTEPADDGRRLLVAPELADVLASLPG